MHISWSFLNKREATKEAVRAYNSMKFVVAHGEEEIKEVRSRMGGATTPALDGMPRTHNPQSHENSLLAGIAEIDVLKERYRQALEYMEWFMPALEQLSEDERYVLDVFYMNGEEDGGRIDHIMEHFKIMRKTAYNRASRSLNHLAMLLYGKA